MRNPFFMWPPRSHVTDPVTSHEAEARARRTVFRGHTAEVLRVVRECPGLNGTQIADRVDGMMFAPDEYRRVCQVRKRLSDLHTVHGLIYPITTAGESEVRWFLKEK